MNIVKGVADLLRRSPSGGQAGENVLWSRAEKLSAPSLQVIFEEVGEEGELKILWQRYDSTIDKSEKRKLLQAFLAHFVQTYGKWEPVQNVQLPVDSFSTYAASENSLGSNNVVKGCSFGHPSEVILIIVQEIARITTFVTEQNNKASFTSRDYLEPSLGLRLGDEAFHVLSAVTIVIRSMHNCRIFSYYGGVQKVTALMKAVVIQLKTLSGHVDGNMLTTIVAKIGLLEKILIYVVTTILSFMDLDPDVHKNLQHIIAAESYVPENRPFQIPSVHGRVISEAGYNFQQKAIVMVLEAGGINWLVELLRVIRRINLEDQWTEWSLQYMALKTLNCALFQNSRAQNHFRSIGGLEVLLDGLSLPSNNHFIFSSERAGSNIFAMFQLQILSLVVLRESIFGNLSNLQFICENGRTQKFASSICSSAFMLQEFIHYKVVSSQLSSHMGVSLSRTDLSEKICSSDCVIDNADGSNMEWISFCVELSKVLCSFLLETEDMNPHAPQSLPVQSSNQISFTYWELSIKWFMKVLLSVFPCIKACSGKNGLPGHLRIMANTLQHHSLCAFRKFLVCAPKLLEVFREEGIWGFIFSENFFYFGPVLEECFVETNPIRKGLKMYVLSSYECPRNQPSLNETIILQREAISFLEFAATLVSNMHNIPECSILLDTLEQSVCNPEIAIILVKSLHRILQLSLEQTLASFSALDAVCRVLKVACIQAQEYKKLHNSSCSSQFQLLGSVEASKHWIACMEASLDLFTEYLSSADEAKSLILHNTACIECLFCLFWDECLGKRVLEHILRLMKLPPSSVEDGAAMLQLCSKYLETFTHVKEKRCDFMELSIDLLVGMQDVLVLDQTYYQALFREGECFLHIISLLNGALDEKISEKLVLNVLQTLTLLLSGNDISKSAFKALVGMGYHTLQSLLLDFCQSRPNLGLLNALLHMLVEGPSNNETQPGASNNENIPLIKNEDVIILFLVILQKSSNPLEHYGLDILQKMLKDSLSNRTTCSKSGMLGFLLDWFFQEDNDDIISKLAQLIQIIGGHSVSGKDIRKIFALLRSDKIGMNQKYCSLLVTCLYSMLKEKGPTAFFEFSGFNSGIVIKTPVQWPNSKGFSFSCWVRIECFPETGLMSLFCFSTDSGKGSLATLGKEKLVFESIGQKRQTVSLPLNLLEKKWHFLCITHSIGRAFSGGSLLRCYIDGGLISSEKCRYAKITESLVNTTIGICGEQASLFSVDGLIPFSGQIGPMYLFSDALSSEQIKGIYLLGPSYMYSFVGHDVPHMSHNSFSNALLDVKDGLSSKIIFGLNAQASDCGTLFNVSSTPELMADKNVFDAVVMDGTQLCSRCILKEIIYCVGGVSVFFPLLTRLGSSGSPLEEEQNDFMLMRPIMNEKLLSAVIELVASVLDENLANQQQMHLFSGFSILGFLLQSVPPQQLNMETLFSLKHLLHVVRSSGLSKLLLKDAISCVYLNPHIWIYVDYEVQRELYMFLIQHFENDTSHLIALCRLPQIIDVICHFYWDKPDSSLVFGIRPLLHPTTRQVIGERPSAEEVRKLRLLLLSLAEMGLKQKIEKQDIKALIAFFERSHDMLCIEDVLQMVMRALSQKHFLASFLEQVDLLGGCHIFINLLQREMEPIRLIGLQFLGKLLVGLPSENKGQKFFNLSVGRTRSLSETNKKEGNTRLQTIISAISDRLFKFSLSDNFCATLFDVLLGGASPKQVLRKHTLPEKNHNKRGGSGSSHFFLPQVLVLIFNFLATCEDNSARERILRNLLDLLDSNPSNIEALMENGWLSWLTTSTGLVALENHEVESEKEAVTSNMTERLVRNIYCIVLSHYIYSVKGGWQQLEETVNFLLVHIEQTKLNHDLLRNIFKDLVASLLKISSEENIFISQPCRDNILYLLKLADEMLTSEIDDEILFPNCILHSDFTPDPLQSEDEHKLNIRYSLLDILNDEDPNQHFRIIWCRKPRDDLVEEEWWDLYDSIWVLICEINGKGPSMKVSKTSAAAGPSLGQRARGLVESLNIPAAEMAAVVVSGGISNALSGKTIKSIDKAMLLRGEKCPRIVFRLVMLYITRANLDRTSNCVQLFISLLPSLLIFDDEQSKNRLQEYIWYILMVRSHSKFFDDDARLDIVSHLVMEMVSYGKPVLATALMVGDDLSDPGSSPMNPGSIYQLINKEKILIAVSDEVKYTKSSKTDRLKQLQELRFRLDNNSAEELSQKKVLEDELQNNINVILSSDDGRRSAYQLDYDENQQNVAEKWIHLFRALIDERGPWSATIVPNSTSIHWKHDKTEDIWRRRPKLKRNYHFDEKLCHASTSTSGKQLSNPVNDGQISNKNFPEQMKHFLLKGVRGIASDIISGPSDDTIDLADDKVTNDENRLHDQHSGLVEEHKNGGDELHEREKSSYPTDMESSEVLLYIPCVLVTPKRKVAGHLSIMQTVLHFSGEFFVEGTGGSSVFKSLQKPINLDLHSCKNSGSDNIDRTTLGNKRKKNKRHRRWKVTKIKAVHSIRYLLQYTAVEIFFSDSLAPVFLNFSSIKDAKNVGTLIVSLRNETLFPKGSSRDRSGMISFVDRRVAVEMAETAREGWQRREISNFEYLMILNTLAGRSYNDLTQYPVFPWVLADYTSEKLDFNKSSTFRDLSKPVGALDSKRFEVFEDRYRNFCDPDIPSFYYGSHYSSMGIVLFYLLRLEPFTALHRNLQGGKFDHADRLFQSIEGTYNNCLSNTSDVKELIPEFFYMPEFLVNLNSYHLGIKQDGEPLADVSLPPWAKDSPEEFIYRNREALESEFVSSNLHHWIDLVFGYKQRGKPAVEATNVFYYLTYEGAVDLEAIDDELQRSAIEDQIANFGQTPIQIFRKKHPRRGLPNPINHPLYFAPASITLTSTVSHTAEKPSSVLFIDLLDSSIVIVNEKFSLTVKTWLTTQLQSGGNFTFSSSQDPYFGVGSDILSSRRIGTPLAENIEISGQCFATLQTAAENYLVSCGSWENSFQLISLNDGRMVQSIRQHKDVVSCIAVTSDGSILATGSYDTTVMVWEVSRHRIMEKRLRSAQTDVNKDLVIMENPCHILCGHDDIITCLFASVDLDIVISGSKDGTCVFHTLREGRYVRSIPHPSSNPLSKLVVSQHGKMVVYSENDLSLHMYSINGKHLAFSECNGRLNCIGLSGCGEFLVCAGDHGHILLRSMHSLEIIRKYEGIGKTITSLVVTPEECFLAGTKDGTLLVYSLENPQLRKSVIPRTRS